MAALRMLLGGSALAAYVLLRKRPRKHSWPAILPFCGGALIALYQVSNFSAMARTGVAVGTTVGIGSSPVFAGILEYVVKGRKPERRWYLSTGLAVLGCFLLFTSRDLRVDRGGVLLALLAGVSYACYALTIRALVDGRSPEVATALVTCIGAVFLSPVLLRADLHWLRQLNGWLSMLHLGLLATAFSYWLFASGLSTVRASTAVTLSLAEPLVATLLGALVLGERIGISASVGLASILSALLLLTLRGGSESDVREEARSGSPQETTGGPCS